MALDWIGCKIFTNLNKEFIRGNANYSHSIFGHKKLDVCLIIKYIYNIYRYIIKELYVALIMFWVM